MLALNPVTVSNEYTDRLRRQVAQGRSQGRVHVLTRPLSDYLRFELHHYYRAHSSAGEEIRILDVTGNGRTFLREPRIFGCSTAPKWFS